VTDEYRRRERGRQIDRRAGILRAPATGEQYGSLSG
jgi:hypothetical protein